MKNKNMRAFMFIVFVALVLLPSVFAVGTALCTDPANYEDCYQENPTFQNLLFIEEPTQEQFDLLLSTNSQQAALYLMTKYDTDFAASYISQTDMKSVDAMGAAVAEKYFSESSSHVREHKAEFQNYLYSKGVSISVVGDISAYKQDGTIVADNGQINVKQFGDKYTFVVNDDDELVLVPKGSTKQYTFEGTVTKNSQGDLRITGEGAFDGMDVQNAQYIRVDQSGNTVIGAEQYGDLHCQSVCHMTYNPKDRTYQLKDAILADYPDFKVTGTLRLDEAYYGLSTTYTVPAGKKLEVRPVVSEEQETLQDQGYRVLANGGKDVQIALEDDTWLDHPADFVLQYIGETAVSVGLVSEETVTGAKESFEETYEEAVEAGIAPETKKDKVRFDSEGTVYLESTDAATDEAASYRMEVDMGAMYLVEQRERELTEGSADYITFTDKPYYEAGDYTKAGTEEYAAVYQIQTIVGAKADGKYGKKTEQAVITWQNNYNDEYGLTPEMPEYLDPTGQWDERSTYAYLRMTKQFEETPALAMDMRGGEAVVDLSSGGFDVVQTGAMDIEVEGLVFKYDAAGNTDKELQAVVKNDISIPITITSCTDGSSGGAVVGAALETATNGAGCNKFSSTEATYGVGSLYEGFASGKISASCPLALGLYEVSSASCASHVTALAEIEGGRYDLYRGTSTSGIIGFSAQDFAEATGQIGNAWDMSHNVRLKGGETLYWKEQSGALPVRDSLLAAPVAYDQTNLEPGDVIGFYYTESSYLDEAAAQGIDGRKNTHVGKVVGKKHEAYTFSGDAQPAAEYIQNQLEVTDTYISGYPVWINSEKAVYANGNYYYADAKGNPTGEAIVLQSGDRVDVQKTLISHLYHAPGTSDEEATRLEDYGYFLSHYPDFSLYEHYRPSESKYQEAETRSAGAVKVEVDNWEEVGDNLAMQGIPDSQIAIALQYVQELNKIPEEGFTSGDVLLIPTRAAFEEHYASTLQEQLKKEGIPNADQLVAALDESTDARMGEYDIPKKEKTDLMEITLELTYMEKGFLPKEEWSLSSDDPEDWRRAHAEEFAREQYAATIEAWTGAVPEDVSYGYLDTQDQVAEENAEELYATGKISTIDYKDPTDMLPEEEGVYDETVFRHGQREVAEIYSRYVTSDMPYEDKLAIVGYAYNRGEDAPMILAVQTQLGELGYPVAQDGIYGDETVTALASFATSTGVSFDSERAKQEIEEGTFDLEKTEVYSAMRQQYTSRFGEEPAYALPPTTKDNFVYREGKYGLIDYCADLTPVKGRCAVDPTES